MEIDARAMFAARASVLAVESRRRRHRQSQALSSTNLERDQNRDFTVETDGARWRGLVWVADCNWKPLASSN